MMTKAKLAIEISVGFGGNLHTGEMTDEASFQAYLLTDTTSFFIIAGRNPADLSYNAKEECLLVDSHKEMVELMLSFLYAEPHKDIDIPMAIKDYGSDYCMYVMATTLLSRERFNPLDVEETLRSLLLTDTWTERVQELIKTCPVT